MADQIISWAIIALIAIAVIYIFIKGIIDGKKRAEEKSREVNDVKIKKGIRYTPEATIVDKAGNEIVTYIQGDIIIKPRKTMKVGKGGEIRPGKWTVLASNESHTTFNIRIGNYVQEYNHGQEIVLSDGDEICPTSTTIILR